jgi:non-ribosomal peptide synthetase component F
MFNTIDKRLLLTSEHFIKQKEYWENKLSGDLEETRLLHRGGNANGGGAMPGRENNESIDIDIPAEVSSGLMALSNRSDLTIYVVLLAALKALIYRYSDWSAESKDITVISPVYEPNLSEDTSNRLLFIRDSIEPDATFKDILLRVGQSVQEAYENQDYPLDELKEMAGIECACLLINIHNPGNIEKIEEASALNGRTGKVVFAFERREEQVKGSVLYHPAMYERHYIQQFSNHFARITGQLMQDLGVRISDVVFLSREERTRLLEAFNDTQSDYPCDGLLHQLFEEQAARTPDHAAVAGPCTAHRTYRTYITYTRLDEKSNQLAYQLQVSGVNPGSIVGILLDRSIEMVTAMLAVLKAGAAYLPIDMDYPQERVG